MQRIELLKTLIDEALKQDGGYFEICNAIAFLFPKELYEPLYQLVKEPTWDGDIICKSSRSVLFELGIAVRVCNKGDTGYTASRYIGYTILKAAKELNIYNPERDQNDTAS